MQLTCSPLPQKLIFSIAGFSSKNRNDFVCFNKVKGFFVPKYAFTCFLPFHFRLRNFSLRRQISRNRSEETFNWFQKFSKALNLSVLGSTLIGTLCPNSLLLEHLVLSSFTGRLFYCTGILGPILFYCTGILGPFLFYCTGILGPILFYCTGILGPLLFYCTGILGPILFYCTGILGPTLFYKITWPYPVLQEHLALSCFTGTLGPILFYRNTWSYPVLQEHLALSSFTGTIGPILFSGTLGSILFYRSTWTYNLLQEHLALPILLLLPILPIFNIITRIHNLFLLIIYINTLDYLNSSAFVYLTNAIHLTPRLSILYSILILTNAIVRIIQFLQHTIGLN